MENDTSLSTDPTDDGAMQAHRVANRPSPWERERVQVTEWCALYGFTPALPVGFRPDMVGIPFDVLVKLVKPKTGGVKL